MEALFMVMVLVILLFAPVLVNCFLSEKLLSKYESLHVEVIRLRHDIAEIRNDE